MQAGDRQKIEQSIALLQSILGGGGSSGSSGSGGAKINVPGFEQEVNQFVALSQNLQPEIKELSAVLVDEIKLMQNIMNYSTNCKKFTQPTIKGLQQKYMEIGKRVEKIEQSKNFHYHGKAVRQMIGATFWVFVDTPEFVFKGAIQSADFNALKFQRQKNLPHNDWWKSVGKAFRTLEDFVKKNYSTGLTFNPSGNGSWDDLLGGSQGSSHRSQTHTSSHHHKQSHKSQATHEPAKRPPKKQLQGLNWLVANFENQKFSFAPNEVQMKHGIFIQNCQNCVIAIQDKFKSVQMNKSSGITLIVNSCISGVQVINGSNLNIVVKGQTPSVSIDKCQKVRLVLNQQHLESDIVTSKVSEFQITYTQSNGQEAKDYTVSEQLITKWNPEKKKFETNIYDKFL